VRNATARPLRSLRRIQLVALLALLQGCTHLEIEDCGGKVLGVNEPRIRSSHFRMRLAYPKAASDRFAPYAAMSALAYAEDTDCGTAKPKITPEDRAKLETALSARGWQEVKDVQWVPACEDDVGLFFRVWKLESAPGHVVIAFRGTWGFKDWLYGNLHWLTRFLPMEDQYSRARAAAKRVFDRFAEDPQKAAHFYATGHSLGGGLAQHLLYSYPDKMIQTIAFDPSSVTGFADQPPANQISACQCSSDQLNGEPRIFRVYAAYEVLANLRIFHKTFLPPERHIQEVRFPHDATHSMQALAFHLLDEANPAEGIPNPWYSGQGNYTANESCTAAFIRSQRASCEMKVTQDQWLKCPQ